MITMRVIWSILSPEHRRSYLRFMGLLFFSALFELTAVTSVALFMKPLAHAHDLVETFPTGPFRFNLKELALATVGMFAASNCLISFCTWSLARFTWRVEANLSSRVLAKILANPQTALRGRNSASIFNDIWCSTLCQKGIRLSLLGWARISSTVLLVLALLTVNFSATLTAAASLGGIYFLIHSVLNGPVLSMSQRWKKALGRRHVITSELLALRKTLFIRQEFKSLLKEFSDVGHEACEQAGTTEMTTEIPRYVLETSALAGIVSLCMALTAQHDHRVLELLSLYGLASYRILPGLHYVFCLNSELRFLRLQAEETRRLLATPTPPTATERLPLNQSFGLQGVTMRYEGREKDVLHGVSIDVPRGLCVGLAGHSGAGKSTILDICLGCLAPQEGHLVVDGASLDDQALSNWRHNLGYLPQQVEVLDDSIQANILLGLPLDPQRLENAVQQACLDKFLDALPDGLQTRVGERGSMMSVGQRQRLGLARALYEDPQVIVLDEMSSSLDAETEEQILQRLQGWKGHKTMIMAAHRGAVLRVCDLIYLLDQGKVIASGTYDELWETEPQFRALLSQKE